MRQCLGQVQLSMGLFQEAEKSFRDDFITFPNNAYSIYGLIQSMKGQKGKYSKDDIFKLERNLQKVWARGEIQLNSSCTQFDTIVLKSRHGRMSGVDIL